MSGMHAMEVTFTPNGWRPDFAATCSDPSADCHYICAEGCESWGEILRNEDGAVLGHVIENWHPGETPHHMEHVEECNYIGFLNNSDDVTEDMTGKPVTLVIPAEFIYEDEAVTWKAIA